MDQSEITELTRKGLRDSKYSSTDIAAMTLLGVLHYGNLIKSGEPHFFRGRRIVSSNTHIFVWPDDCESVQNVWDTNTNAVSITAATNASPINIEAASHGLADDNIVLVTGIVGNTAGNGTWKVTYVDDDNVTLNGSTGNAAWVSGGKILKWSSNFRKIEKRSPDAQNLLNRWRWYPEGKTVVVDDINFTNDVIIDYIKRPSAVGDIPAEYHMGLVGYNVKQLLRVPEQTDPRFQDLLNSFNTHNMLYKTTEEMIRSTFNVTTEATEFTDSERWDII